MNLASIWLKLHNFIELGIRVLEHKLGNAKLPKIREIKGNYVRTTRKKICEKKGQRWSAIRRMNERGRNYDFLC
jgi:hypothetical protein